jgi:hypothetical protein
VKVRLRRLRPYRLIASCSSNSVHVKEQRRNEAGPGPDVQRGPRVDQWQEGIEALILLASTPARGDGRRLSVAAQVEVRGHAVQVPLDTALVHVDGE